MPSSFVPSLFGRARTLGFSIESNMAACGLGHRVVHLFMLGAPGRSGWQALWLRNWRARRDVWGTAVFTHGPSSWKEDLDTVQRDTPWQAEAPENAEPRTSVAPPAFPEVFRTYSAFVWRVLLRLGVAEADVDDIAQEVFFGVHRTLPSFEGRCSLRTWIYGICHRRAVDYRRRAKVRPELYAGEPSEQPVEASQERDLALRRARREMQRVLDELDDDKRTVFVLFDIEGLPMEEVAEIVSCPLQTAYSRLYAARRKVEASLARTRSERRSL